jgi:hypothetical protein
MLLCTAVTGLHAGRPRDEYLGTEKGKVLHTLTLVLLICRGADGIAIVPAHHDTSAAQPLSQQLQFQAGCVVLVTCRQQHNAGHQQWVTSAAG